MATSVRDPVVKGICANLAEGKNLAEDNGNATTLPPARTAGFARSSAKPDSDDQIANIAERIAGSRWAPGYCTSLSTETHKAQEKRRYRNQWLCGADRASQPRTPISIRASVEGSGTTSSRSLPDMHSLAGNPSIVPLQWSPRLPAIVPASIRT